MSSVVAQDRLGLGGAAVLPLCEAARLLPVSSARAKAWLIDQGLVKELLGAKVVIWGHVLSALEEVEAAARLHRGTRGKPMGKVKLP